MKNKLFGQLGNKLKGNGLVLFLVCLLGLTGFFTYRTIIGINARLERQHLRNIQQTPSPQPTEDVQDVQQEQRDVPLPASPSQVQAKPESTSQPTPAQETEAPQPVQKTFILPVNGKIFAAFSGDELVYNRTLDDWRTHNGIDISAAPNDPVKAGADGTVKAVYEDGMLGNVVEIDHNGFIARYCGMGPNIFVKAGNSVKQGESIGAVGEITLEIAEESHIHLEIIKDGKNINPDSLLD